MQQVPWQIFTALMNNLRKIVKSYESSNSPKNLKKTYDHKIGRCLENSSNLEILKILKFEILFAIW